MVVASLLGIVDDCLDPGHMILEPDFFPPAFDPLSALSYYVTWVPINLYFHEKILDDRLIDSRSYCTKWYE